MPNLASKGKILTFYSYKGGTGRSMLLANVAWLLALKGKRVLVIDWDLEAPGLHRYFAPFLDDKELAWSDGLMNFVENYKIKALTPPDPDSDAGSKWFVPYADIRQYAVSLKWDFPEQGRLDFVPAGRQDKSYSELVNSFNWLDFYKRLGGSHFLDEAASQMRDAYDYVLIDSRTGVSDTSGICTVKMPDALVVCFTLNYQSINGAAAIADYAHAQRLALTPQSDFNIFPVPTRLENAQKKKMERRREYARAKRFARYPITLHRGSREDYWSEVGVWYDTYYAYEEILAAFGEKELEVSSLLAAVQRITTYLTEGTTDVSLRLPLPRREEILRAFEADTYEAPDTEAQSDARPDEAIAMLLPDVRDAARRALLRLVRIGDAPRYEVTATTAALTEFDASARQALDVLRRSQVVTIENADDPAAARVQIAPRISLATFTQLGVWAQADRDFLVWRQQLGSYVLQWERTSRGESNLLNDSALTIAITWLRQRPMDLGPTEQAFINASVERDARLRQERAQEQISRFIADRVARNDPPPAPPRLGTHIKAGGEPKAVPLSEALVKAREILRGKKATFDEMRSLAKQLKNEQDFTYARRLLARAIADSPLNFDKTLRLKIYQECALCTYKDTDLPIDQRLDAALELLRQADDLETTVNQETLGLVGAVYKRKWEVDSQIHHLERSLHYYARGYEQGAANDQGYTGINAAFVLDLLAAQTVELPIPGQPTRASGDPRLAEARRIREDIVTTVAPLFLHPDYEWLSKAWWFYATIAESLFGLGRYKEAVDWLERGRTAIPALPEWEKQSSLQQLARLALLRSTDVPAASIEYSEAWRALVSFFGGQAAAVRSAFTGKVGLALSGGGFRAALYHIGVLAKLAELDVLRSVEVLSCVSGGSIVGAHYYLEVRNLLESKADDEITREDYVEIVKRIERDFVLGVQRNVRMRVLAGLFTNLRMLFQRGYSRTLRVGELYESEIFSRVADGEANQPRMLSGLTIHPLGEKPNFAPKRDNWGRQAKAPVLILNATSLNTGHSWQFTASWMGESPTRIDTTIDGNERLRQMYYWEAPEAYRHVRLGAAVAASACVPGVFEPLSLSGLYPDRTVRLIDGGVCDNQGIGGLLDQDCTVALVSDGSGQNEADRNPSDGVLGVPLRANAVLQGRIREAQAHELRARKRSLLLRGLMFVHLKEDLDVDPVDWVDCPDPYDASTDARPLSRRGPLTAYGLDKEVQSLLAGVRTDLDSFADVEADALMTSGYRMTEYQFKHSVDLAGVPVAGDPEPWAFLGVERGMTSGGKSQARLKRFLAVSKYTAFKPWRLSMPLKFTAIVLALGALAGIAWVWAKYPNQPVFPQMTLGELLRDAGWAAISVFATLRLGRTLGSALRWRESLYRVGVGIGMSVFGWLVARVHLMLFDPLFLRLGSASRFKEQADREAPVA